MIYEEGGIQRTGHIGGGQYNTPLVAASIGEQLNAGVTHSDTLDDAKAKIDAYRSRLAKPDGFSSSKPFLAGIKEKARAFPRNPLYMAFVVGCATSAIAGLVAEIYLNPVGSATLRAVVSNVSVAAFFAGAVVGAIIGLALRMAHKTKTG